MQQIEAMQARVQAAEPLPELLAAGWDAFTVVLETCQASEERGWEWFAALAFTAAAASRGRLLLASAPSFPLSERSQARHDVGVMHDLERVLATLAILASLLHDRLWHAAADAASAGDLEACLEAASYADQIFELLSRDE